MSERISKLTETTLIPLSMVIALVGGVFWLSTMYAQGAANAKAQEETKVEILEIKKKQEKYVEDMALIRESLIELKTLIKRQR